MDEQTKILLELSTKLGSIDAKLTNVCETLLRHESRIALLEQDMTKMKATSSQKSWKDDAMKWLIRCLIGTVGIIATLTGSSAAISKISQMQIQ